MDSILNFFYWTLMEWDKKIPLGRQDLQDYWPWLNTLRCSSKFNGVKIFFASSEVPLGRRPFQLNNPVYPVCSGHRLHHKHPRAYRRHYPNRHYFKGLSFESKESPDQRNGQQRCHQCCGSHNQGEFLCQHHDCFHIYL